MSSLQIAGLVAFVVCFFVGHHVAQKGISTLSTEQKGRCLEIVAPFGRWYLILMLIAVVIGLVFDMTESRFQGIGGWVVFLSFAALMIIAGLVVGERLKKNELPRIYCRSYLVSRLIYAVGALMFVVAFMIRG